MEVLGQIIEKCKAKISFLETERVMLYNNHLKAKEMAEREDIGLRLSNWYKSQSQKYKREAKAIEKQKAIYTEFVEDLDYVNIRTKEDK